MSRFAILVVTAALAAACGAKTSEASHNAARTKNCVDNYTVGVDQFANKSEVRYAEHFTLSYKDNYKIVKVRPSNGRRTLTYVLVQCGTPKPELTGELAKATTVEIPVGTVAAESGTQVAGLAEIGEANSITGYPGTELITTPAAARRVKSGEITNIGRQGDVNIEAAIALDPAVLFTSGMSDLGKVAQAGIAVVTDADWQEQDPLGRAEWVKFLAAFFNAEATANEKFDGVAADYITLRDKVTKANEPRPSMFANTVFDGVWSMPGGDSYAARQFHDAGGAYAFADNKSQQVLQLTLEAVLDRAQDADLWVQAGITWNTLTDALAEEPRYAQFRAYQRDNVWNFARKTNSAGSVDYLSTGAVRPDLALADFVKIMHPTLVPDHEFVWFQKVPS